MTNEPVRVTVVLPVHNGERWLAQAVDSVLAQTFADLELLVVDDGSTDATPDILRAIRDPRVRVLRNDANRGIVASLNRGVAAARGDLIARMDADDVCRVDRLAVQVRFLDEHPDVGIVGGGIQQIDAAGAPTVPPLASLPTRPSHIRWLLWWHNVVNHPTVVIRRALLEELAGYDATAFPAEDYDLWLRGAERTRIANVDAVVLDYRAHQTSISTARRDDSEAQALRAVIAAQERALGHPVPAAAIALLRQPHLLRDPATEVATALAALSNVAELMAVWHAREQPDADDRALARNDAGRWVAAMVLACLPGRPVVAARVLTHRAGLPLATATFAVASEALGRIRRKLPRSPPARPPLAPR